MKPTPFTSGMIKPEVVRVFEDWRMYRHSSGKAGLHSGVLRYWETALMTETLLQLSLALCGEVSAFGHFPGIPLCIQQAQGNTVP